MSETYVLKDDGTSSALRDASILNRTFRGISERMQQSIGKPIITFSFNNNFGFYCNGVLRIECQEHPLEYWLENKKQLCTRFKYEKEDQERLDLFLELINKITNKVNE